MDKVGGIPGGWSKETAATPDIQNLCDEIRPQLQKASEQNFLLFEAVTYEEQVVAGMNYLVKVKVSPPGIDNCAWVCFYQPLNNGPLVLQKYRLDKNINDPLPPNGIC